jgi:allophanate hydrolase
MSAAADRVDAFLEQLARRERPEAWIHVRAAADLRGEAAAVDARVAAGEALPLAGVVVAVKDNIDVAGCPTTAAAPSYRYEPRDDAPAVARLRAAGAIVVGKTNLDQFATGLVGTRSPFGAVRHAESAAHISGGSSSGSAVAVALGLVDLALGTDTAGSGRVPAALHGLWGFKPTKGRIPTTGVVPACASLDVVTVFARDPRLGRRAVDLMAGPDAGDPLSSRDRPLAPPPTGGLIVVPAREELGGMAPGWVDAFDAVVDAARAAGFVVEERGLAPLLAAARMLYESSFVAERYAAVGDHLEAARDADTPGIDPTVSAIVLAGARFTAAQLFADLRTLERHRAEASSLLAGATAILTPTTTWHPTLTEVAADPVGANARMGRFTNFANLLDMAAVAFPAGRVDGLPFGAMLTGPAHTDDALAAIAARIGECMGTVSGAAEPIEAGSDHVDLFVVGAHRAGQPLNHELTERGGVLVRRATTAPRYRLYALDTRPAKPGLVRAPGRDAGAGAIVGEVWRLPLVGFGAFVHGVPAPMAIGTVELAGGEWVDGFVCEPIALEGATDITEAADWVAWHHSLTGETHA